MGAAIKRGIWLVLRPIVFRLALLELERISRDIRGFKVRRMRMFLELAR